MIDNDGKHQRYSLAVSAEVLAIFDDEDDDPMHPVVAVFDRDHDAEAERRLAELNSGTSKRGRRK